MSIKSLQTKAQKVIGQYGDCDIHISYEESESLKICVHCGGIKVFTGNEDVKDCCICRFCGNSTAEFFYYFIERNIFTEISIADTLDRLISHESER